MDSKKTLALASKLYQRLLALKKSGESVEDVIARLIEGSSASAEKIPWHLQRKIVVLGPPASGKSMLVKFFFENKDPRLILSDFLLPTKITEETTYDWLDLRVAVVDVGHDDFEQVIAGPQSRYLANASEIIYVFDISTWTSQKALIASEIDVILKVKGQSAPGSNFTCILHKKDTVQKELLGEILGEVSSMLARIKGGETVRVETTSIIPKHSNEAFRVLRNILLRHSSLLRQALLPGFTRA